MVILITGASHSGKTALSQRLLEKYKYPYLSIDHLKMGLIRSGNTNLSPLSDDEKLTEYLWPIVREIIKTAIENKQNLIVEGCYIPWWWTEDFSEEYLGEIKCFCLIMTEKYIKESFDKIKEFANVIEKRLCEDLFLDDVIRDNENYLRFSEDKNTNIVLIDEEYNIDLEVTQ